MLSCASFSQLRRLPRFLVESLEFTKALDSMDVWVGAGGMEERAMKLEVEEGGGYDVDCGSSTPSGDVGELGGCKSWKESTSVSAVASWVSKERRLR